MQTFVKNLQKLAKNIYEMKQSRGNYTWSPQFLFDQCWIGERDLDESDRVRDHCQASVKFLGFANSKYNLKQRTVNYIPIFAHNFSKSDLHFISKIYTFSQKIVKFK